MADDDLNRLYRSHRAGLDQHSTQANGYIWQRQFLREQEVLKAQIQVRARPDSRVLDVGCGSGEMLAGVVPESCQPMGIEIDAEMCRAASSSGLPAIQADAFSMPIAENTLDLAINCQFINQLTDISDLFSEFNRVLKPGGYLIMTWRAADSLPHRIAQFVLRLIRSEFAAYPQSLHTTEAVVDTARRVGFQMVETGHIPIALPLLPRTASSHHPLEQIWSVTRYAVFTA